MREKKPKILMIDDDEQILFAMKAVFEYQGWESLSAQDVLGGLRLFRSEKPDLILIDYHLPQINGIKGVQMIRELDGEIPSSSLPLTRARRWRTGSLRRGPAILL